MSCRFINRGFAVGIYTTNSPEACHYVAADCEANICVVENDVQLQKILQVRDRLPHLRAIVQYTGKLTEKYSNVYTVCDNPVVFLYDIRRYVPWTGDTLTS